MAHDVPLLLSQYPPAEALEYWLRAFITFITANRGLGWSLKAADTQHSELYRYVEDVTLDCLAIFLVAGQDSGQIRRDVTTHDLLYALGGICLVSDTDTRAAQASRLLTLLMDGLRAEPGTLQRTDDPPADRARAGRGSGPLIYRLPAYVP
jgi:hypothetical protein